MNGMTAIASALGNHAAAAVKGGIKGMMIGRKDTFLLPIKNIDRERGWNVRLDSPDNAEHIRKIADALLANGAKILEPLTVIVRDGIAYLRDGHCRFAAVLLANQEGANIEAVFCKTEDAKASEADMLFGIFTRNGGKPLTPLETGLLFLKLMKEGVPLPEIAFKTGIGEQYAADLVMLAQADAPILELVKDGKVASTLAVKVMKADGANAAQTLTESYKIAVQAGKEKATEKHVAIFAEKVASGEIAGMAPLEEGDGKDQLPMFEQGGEAAAAETVAPAVAPVKKTVTNVVPKHAIKAVADELSGCIDDLVMVLQQEKLNVKYLHIIKAAQEAQAKLPK